MAKTELTNADVFSWIDGIAPFETCEPWDNSGLLAGSMKSRVTGIYCALDVSAKVIDDAIAKGCNLIVTHHPIMFGGRKNLREDDAEGRMLCSLVRNNISVISAHTNFDKAEGGVNDILAKRIGIESPKLIEGDEEGFLRIGEIRPMRLDAFTDFVKRTLGDAVRAYGDPEMIVRKVAVCGGAGGEFAAFAQKCGADAYVTGEMRYHDSLDLAQTGFATLQAGHDATEKIAVERFKQLFETKLAEYGINIPVYLSEIDSFSLRLI